MEKSIGPINSIVLARAGESDKIYKKDQSSIELNGLCELMIKENQFMNFNDRVDYLQELSDKLFSVEYYLNDFVSTGIMYYNLLDMYNIEIFGKTYNCLMLNDEQNITQGLEENIHTDRPETSETDYTKADKTDRKINQTYLIVDKQNQKIEGVIKQIGDRTDKTTTITADIDGLNSKVSQIVDLTREVTGIKSVTLENCANGELLKLIIYGNNSELIPLTLSNDLYLSNHMHLENYNSLITVTNENGESVRYDLKITDKLRQRGNVKDEYIIESGKAKIIRRINTDGTIKDNPTEEDLGELAIILSQGTNTVSIDEYNFEMYIKYAILSDLANTFATKVELNTSITQTSKAIMSEVNKKVDENEFGTKIEQNSEAVKLAWNQISDYIQMMIIQGNASFAVLDENKKVLMALDKAGQHFYKSDGTTIFGEMATNKEEDNNFISFAVNGTYGQDIDNGMAWGIKTNDGKFHPVLYLKDFHMGAEQADDFFGKLVLQYCDLILSGMESGIQSGNVRMYGNAFNGITFEDINTGKTIMSILPEGTYSYGAFNLLDTISFYRNMAGSNSLKIGNDNKYVLIQDDGSLHVMSGIVLLGTSQKKVTFDLYVQSAANIWGNLYVNGDVYANNISSDRRLKKNITDSTTSALDIINKIQHKEFDKIDDNKHYKIGYIAQELEQIDKNFVLKRETNKEKGIEERYYINELPIIATLTKAIQEQQEQIKELKKEIENLKGEKNG